MPKPHRVVLDRVSGYADEAAAFMRRRRHVRRPFARVYRTDGSSVDHAADSEAGAALFAAAGRLLELAATKVER
jgi:transposase